MIWIIPLLNALFGWGVISLLFCLLFHPYQKKNFFVFEIQGFIPGHLNTWGAQAGEYITEHVVNIQQMKAGLLQSEKLKVIHNLIEEKADDFLRNKLKEKIPVFSMFITEGMISKVKEVLVQELDGMVPSVIDSVAAGVEEQFNARKMIASKLDALTAKQTEDFFYRHAGRSLGMIKLAAAFCGLLLGVMEVVIIKTW